MRSTNLILITLMLCQYGGGRTYAVSRNLQGRQPSLFERAASFSKELAENRFDSLLAELNETVEQGEASTKSAPEKGFANIRRLTELKESLVEESEKIQEYFGQLEGFLKQKGLPHEILNRHLSFVRAYDAKYETLMESLKAIESSHKDATGLWAKLTGRNKKVDWDAAIGKTLTFLEENTARPRESQFDPRNLPHRSIRADKPVQPKLTREEWLKAFPKDPAVQSSAAKADDFVFATAAPTAADLAETIEVKFTPEIIKLADSLGKNPVKIFNWVRNNIEFVPTWGSIQGARLCMETRTGNAFDTASLLIALLRYSGISARYQMGTIEVSVEKFKNWAGGFTDADAAASLFASGGVPSVVRRLNQSGQVVTVRLEHVWVKAFVDYAPSGGAVTAQGETWVAMDASFKQYSLSPGVDFETVTPADFQALIDQLTSTATIDPATGSVTSIDTEAMELFFNQLSDQRVNYIRAHLPNATAQEIFGRRAVSGRPLGLLPASAPYRVLARASEMAQIPDGLRHKVTIGLGTNSDTTDQWNYTATLPELAGKNVLLFYVPDSQADKQLLDSIFAALGQGQALTLPSSLNLSPQLYIGGQMVTTGHALRAGSPVFLQIRFWSPTVVTPAILNRMIAGESTAIGLDLQGTSPAQVRTLIQKTQDLIAKIQQDGPQSIRGYDLVEAVVSGTILTWFNIMDAANRFTSASAGVVTIRYPSAGLFFLKQKVSSFFGAAASISPEAFNMDIDEDVVVSVAKDGDAMKAAHLSYSQGALGSALEAIVPVAFLSLPNDPVSGTSTISALRQANDEGVPIFSIDSSNSATVIPLLQIDSGDLADIQDAINAGLQVIVSRTSVSADGHSTLGIVVKDPQTGSAAFLISGGTNGARLYLRIAAQAAAHAFLTVSPDISPNYPLTLFDVTEEMAEEAYEALKEWEQRTVRSDPENITPECYKAAFVLNRVGSRVGWTECRICDLVTFNGLYISAKTICSVPESREWVAFPIRIGS